MVIDVAVQSDCNIRKKEYKKYQGLNKEQERMWKVKAKVVPIEAIVIEKEDSPTYVFLSLEQITSLLEQDVDGVQRKMEVILNFNEPQTNLKEAVLVDYYVSGFWWGKEKNFSSQQLIGFMGLLHHLMGNIETKGMKLEENFLELSRALAGIGNSILSGRGSLSTFSVDQAKEVIDYFKISLFQHYKLYEWMFNFPREELVLNAKQVIEVAKPADTPFPAPLEEGISSEIYFQFIAPPPLLQMTEESKDIQQPCDESGKLKEEVDPLSGYTIGEVKTVLNKVTGDAIDSLQAEINEMLRVQEEA
ncbi:ciliary-associated calcium-binding coiled-coil protein 1 [Pelodytes ibericus]